MKTSLLAIFVAISSSFVVRAQVPDKDPFIKGESGTAAGGEEGAAGVNLSAYVEFIEIPTASLHQLMSDPDLVLSDGDAVRRAVQERIDDGDAKIVESALVTSASGVRSKFESVKELIYPVQWDSPQTETPNVAASLAQREGDGHRFPVPMVENGIAYWPPSSYPHPTTFEMRTLGTFLEQHPWLAANGLEWKFSIAPEIVSQAVSRSPLTLSTPFGPYDPVATPIMRSRRTEVPEQTAPIGDTIWLGTVASPENSETEGGVSVMTFLRGFSQTLTDKTVITPQVSTLVVEFIEVEASDVNDYFRALPESEISARNLRGQLEEKLESEEASLIELVTLRCQAGRLSTYSAVDELIYPTEYYPARLPTYPLPKESAESTGEQLEPFARFWSPRVYPTPTAFETRNVGTHMMATMGPQDGSDELLWQIQPEIVKYLGNRAISEFRTPRGMEPLGTMPIFSTLRVTTSVYMTPGHDILLGMASPWNDEGEWDNERRVLVFAKLAE